MKFKIKSSELSKRLKQLEKVVLQRNVIPILADVMIDIHENVAVLTTSDGELWLSIKCPIEYSDGDAKLCVNVKDLLSLTSDIDGVIDIDMDENTCQINCNYGRGYFVMPYDKADEYPNSTNIEGDVKSVIVEGKKIYNAIRMTEFAVSTNTAITTIQPIYGGMNFKFGEQGLTVSSTDMFKVAIYNDTTIKSEEGRVTIPRKAIVVMSSILNGIEGEVKMSFGESNVSVSNSEIKLSSRLIGGNFPNCQSVIPSTSSVVVSIKKNELLLALKRVMPMANDCSELTIMTFNKGCVTLSAENTISGKLASETLDCECRQSFKIGFKGSDLAEIIRNIEDDDIVIEMMDNACGGVFYAASTYSKDEYVSLLSASIIK